MGDTLEAVVSVVPLGPEFPVCVGGHPSWTTLAAGAESNWTLCMKFSMVSGKVSVGFSGTA